VTFLSEKEKVSQIRLKKMKNGSFNPGGAGEKASLIPVPGKKREKDKVSHSKKKKGGRRRLAFHLLTSEGGLSRLPFGKGKNEKEAMDRRERTFLKRGASLKRQENSSLNRRNAEEQGSLAQEDVTLSLVLRKEVF